jgi:hypothetical protein
VHEHHSLSVEEKNIRKREALDYIADDEKEAIVGARPNENEKYCDKKAINYSIEEFFLEEHACHCL